MIRHALAIALLALPPATTLAEPYAVVVSRATADDSQWRPVVQALVAKHQAQVITYASDVTEALAPLRALQPRYACFVAQPQDAGRMFVVKIHRLTRQLDDDPYTDVLWGILTGYRAEDALRIAQAKEPLIVRKGAAGTGLDLNLFDQGVWYSEGKAGEYTQKQPGGAPEKKQGPTDSTKALVDTLNDLQPDLFLTSGHATERDWQIGYSYKNGQFRCKDGVLFGLDTQGQKFPIHSPNPKVYLPAGNCLMGHIDSPQAMALAWMSSAGVNQMIGYTVSTWFGHAGWGTKDYFLSDPGRYTLAEAFYFNQQLLLHELEERFPKSARTLIDDYGMERNPQLIPRLAAQLGYTQFDKTAQENLGLLWDRDTLAFYGDPAWEARLAKRDWPWEMTLSTDGDTHTLTLRAKADCTPARPPAMLLPQRLRDIQVTAGQELQPLITGRFVIVLKPGKLEAGTDAKVVFTAKRIGA